MMFCTDNTFLLLNFSSFSNTYLIMFRVGSIGTEVKGAADIISYEALSWLKGCPFGPVYKVTGTLYVVGEFTYKGFNTFVRMLATP